MPNKDEDSAWNILWLAVYACARAMLAILTFAIVLMVFYICQKEFHSDQLVWASIAAMIIYVLTGFMQPPEDEDDYDLGD